MAVPRPASGVEHVLRSGDSTAVIASVGASLRSFRCGEQDLVLGFESDEVRPAFRGAVLAPWPNRVAGGSWEWAGVRHQLPLTEPERGHALHGLVAWSDWTATDTSATAVTLTTSVTAQPGYPFSLDLAVTWSLDADLRCELVATNTGSTDAPYGCGIHPYLVAPTGSLDEWTLHVPAERELMTDDAKVPTDLVTTIAEHDFRTPRTIGQAEVDHAFTQIEFDARRESAVSVVDELGAGVRLVFGSGTPWVQVCTSDWPSRPGHRAAVAIEPMTCPPNALQRHEDLIVLAPGAQHSAWWRIERVAP